jgi:hypothetical protein
MQRPVSPFYHLVNSVRRLARVLKWREQNTVGHDWTRTAVLFLASGLCWVRTGKERVCAFLDFRSSKFETNLTTMRVATESKLIVNQRS